MPQGNGPARREAGRGARGGPRTPQFINKYSGRAETTIGNAAQNRVGASLDLRRSGMC